MPSRWARSRSSAAGEEPVRHNTRIGIADEILICEGDLIGKTRQQLRSVHFRRDRDWLQS
jgi:hypothetical protein